MNGILIPHWTLSVGGSWDTLQSIRPSHLTCYSYCELTLVFVSLYCEVMVVMVVMVVVRVMLVSLCCTTTRPGVSALTVSSSRPFYLYLCLSPSPVSQYAAVTLQPTGFFTGSKRAAPAGPCGY